MSRVVLRCPHCGTVAAKPGECEACSEAAVKYYCTNHQPGRWLDGPDCPECGARLGEPERQPTDRPSAPRRRDRPAATPPVSPMAAPRPEAPDLRPKVGRTPWGRAKRPVVVFDTPDDATREMGRRPVSLPDLLRAARRRGHAPERDVSSYAPAASPVASFIRRAIFLALFLVLALLAFGVLAGGPLLEILLSLLLNSGRYY